ncbi:cardiolipin synthase [Phosphitispora sp. TUW77]|uniref:cardiolipin synthase n=1 Tax=Phosphitispora sp. TUW77 TaxID=3152361 RepID=UPI003AB42FF8
MLTDFWSLYGDKIVWVYSVSTTVLILVVSFLIFMEKKNPYKTIAWLAVLNIFPILGFIIYLMLGQNLRKRKIVRTKYINEMKHLKNLVDHQIDCIKNDCELTKELNSKKQLINLMLHNAKAPFTRNNSVEILSDGTEAFESIFAALEKAVNHIHVEYYIIKDDNTGRRLKDILIKKACEGVSVKVIYDAVGSWGLSGKYTQEMEQNGIQIKPFLPVIIPYITNKLNYRNHRKIVVIDGSVGFMGGLNVGDEYLGYHPNLGKWRDTHLKLEGAAVHFLQIIFMLDWEFVSHEKLPDQMEPSYFPETNKFQGHAIQIAASGPDSDWESIRQSYFALITSAHNSIKITTPYLIPDEGISLALKTAALSGVDVKIILPGKPDHKIVFWASQSYFDELMEAGIQIYLYQPGFIHAKIISVDGEVASLGSANLDMRSFQLNFEVNAMIYDKTLVTQLEIDFARDLALANKIDLAAFSARPIRSKIRQSAARLLSPIL